MKNRPPARPARSLGDREAEALHRRYFGGLHVLLTDNGDQAFDTLLAHLRQCGLDMTRGRLYLREAGSRGWLRSEKRGGRWMYSLPASHIDFNRFGSAATS